MKSSVKIILLCGCLIIACTHRSAANDSTEASGPAKSMLEAETGMQEPPDDANSDWLEAHESNGPEGTRGVPMQRISRFQIGLVLLVLAAGSGLTFQTGKKKI